MSRNTNGRQPVSNRLYSASLKTRVSRTITPRGSQRPVPTVKKLSPNTRTSQNIHAKSTKSMDKVPAVISIKKSQIPEIVISEAISSVFENNANSMHFKEAARAAMEIQSPNSVLAIYSKARDLFLERLNRVEIKNIDEMITEFNTFIKEAKQISTFMSFVGLELIENSKEALPKWKYKEEMEKHEKRCTTLAIEVWNERIHDKCINTIGRDIRRVLEGSAFQSPIDPNVKKMNDIFDILGRNYVPYVIDAFDAGFKQRVKAEEPKGTGKEETAMKILVDGVKRLGSVFGDQHIQEQLFIKNAKDLIPGLVHSRDKSILHELKNFLKPLILEEVNSIIIEEMKSESVPIEYFSLAGFYEYFTSILPSEGQVKMVVGTYINRTENRFPALFISLLYSHMDVRRNLLPLSVLPPLYMLQESLSEELCKAEMIRLLTKRGETPPQDFVKSERDFLVFLRNVLGRHVVRPVLLLLDDFVVVDSFVIVNRSLWRPLIGSDETKFPKEIHSQSIAMLKRFERPRKKLTLTASFSSAVVTATYSDGKSRQYIMTLLQYELIQMMLIGNCSFSMLEVDENVLATNLNYLVKAKIVKKEGHRYVVCCSPPSGKRINVFDASIKIKKIDRSGNAVLGEGGRDANFSSMVESVIARVMKLERSMEEESLIRRALNEIPPHFGISKDDVVAAMRSLLQNDYLSRDPDNGSIIVYCP